MRSGKSSFNVFFGFMIFIALMNGGLSAAVPFIIFFLIVNAFSKKPNERKRVPNTGRYQTNNRERARRQADLARQRAEQARREEIRRRQGTKRRTTVAKRNPFKKSGISKFKEYDYDGAIMDFEKALTINPEDIAVHFNLAASYSLTEEKDKAFSALDKAVKYGFKDFEKINTHDALAYLRIQPEFDAFKANGYRMGGSSNGSGPQIKKEEAEGLAPNLLEQLKRLQELREKGVLTEEEFVVQKKKILR